MGEGLGEIYWLIQTGWMAYLVVNLPHTFKVVGSISTLDKHSCDVLQVH